MPDRDTVPAPAPPIPQTPWVWPNPCSTLHIPLYLSEEFGCIRQLPAIIQQGLPSEELPVLKFLDLQLSSQSAGFVTTQINTWFSHLASDEDFTYLFEQPIPPLECMEALDEAMPKAWLDGAQSIADLQFNNGQDQLPLWALAYWKEASKTIQKQKNWKQGIHWLTEESKCDASLPRIDIEDLLVSLAWNLPTQWNSDEGTHVFAQLLSNCVLCGTIMDAMISNLQE